MRRQPPRPNRIYPATSGLDHLRNQDRIGVTQIDQIHLVGDRALLDVGVELSKEPGGKVVSRQDRDVDVAVLPRIAACAGSEQPYRRIMLTECAEHHPS
jgi:hypothetical protein